MQLLRSKSHDRLVTTMTAHLSGIHPPVLTLKRRVDRFLSKPVPPSHTEAAEAWTRQARNLGRSTVRFLIQALEKGTEAEQYAALLALRQQGYTAWGEGYEETLVYKISRNGKSTVIKPLLRS